MDSIDEGDSSLLDDVSLAIHQGHGGEYSLDEESKHDHHQQYANSDSAQASAQ